MQDYIYSVIAFLAMAIHLIVNFELRPGQGAITAHGSREYRGFLLGVFFYYVVDASWGVLAGLRWTRLLYFDSMLYYIAIAVSVLTWSRFVIAYLSIRGWPKRILSWGGYALLLLYVVLLAANVFNNCLFRFDALGHYASGPLRLPVVGIPGDPAAVQLIGVNVMPRVGVLFPDRPDKVDRVFFPLDRRRVADKNRFLLGQLRRGGPGQCDALQVFIHSRNIPLVFPSQIAVASVVSSP